MDTIRISGKNGKIYTFNLFPKDTHFKDLPGVYVFLRKDANGEWHVIYIGETDSFKDRIDQNIENHHQWKCIEKNRYTHIAVLTVNGIRQKRLGIETDLRGSNPSLCNEQ